MIIGGTKKKEWNDMTIQEFDNSVLGYQNKIKELEAENQRLKEAIEKADDQLQMAIKLWADRKDLVHSYILSAQEALEK